LQEPSCDLYHPKVCVCNVIHPAQADEQDLPTLLPSGWKCFMGVLLSPTRDASLRWPFTNIHRLLKATRASQQHPFQQERLLPRCCCARPGRAEGSSEESAAINRAEFLLTLLQTYEEEFLAQCGRMIGLPESVHHTSTPLTSSSDALTFSPAVSATMCASVRTTDSVATTTVHAMVLACRSIAKFAHSHPECEPAVSLAHAFFDRLLPHLLGSVVFAPCAMRKLVLGCLALARHMLPLARFVTLVAFLSQSLSLVASTPTAASSLKVDAHAGAHFVTISRPATCLDRSGPHDATRDDTPQQPATADSALSQLACMDSCVSPDLAGDNRRKFVLLALEALEALSNHCENEHTRWHGSLSGPQVSIDFWLTQVGVLLAGLTPDAFLELFMDQDDDLFHGLRLLLGLLTQQPANAALPALDSWSPACTVFSRSLFEHSCAAVTAQLSPSELFTEFICLMGGDATVLLDLLLADNPVFLDFLLSFLRACEAKRINLASVSVLSVCMWCVCVCVCVCVCERESIAHFHTVFVAFVSSVKSGTCSIACVLTSSPPV
jgi:hypothetical protein